MARLVPPTEVTYGLEVGKSTCCWSEPGSFVPGSRSRSRLRRRRSRCPRPRRPGRSQVVDLDLAGLVGGLAPRVADDAGQVVVDDQRERCPKVLVVAACRADVGDVRAWRHAVRRLDVERLLAVPARRVALVGRGLGEVAGQVLGVLTGRELGVRR